MNYIRLIISSLILAYGISYSRYYTLYQWISLFLVSFILSLFFLYLFYYIMNYFSKSKKFKYDITGLRIIFKKKYFDLKKEDFVSITRVFPIDFLITFIFILATNGFIFPILTYNFKEKPLNSLKSDISYKEIAQTLMYSLFSILIFYIFITYLFSQNWLLRGLLILIRKIMLVLLITYLIPWSYLLSPIANMLKAGFEKSFVSDKFIFIKKSAYIFYAILTFFLFFLSYIPNPIILFTFSLIAYIIFLIIMAL